MSRRARLVTLWLVSDLALFLGCYALAYFFRVGFILSNDFPFGNYLSIALLVSPVWLATLVITRTFSLFRKQWSVRTFAYIAYAAVVSTALFALTYYFVYGLFFSRLLLFSALLFTAVIPWLWHLVFGLILRTALRTDPPAYPTLIIGATRESARLIKLLEKNKSPLKPVAILDGRGVKEKEMEGIPVAGKLNKLDETLDRYKITHMIQCADLEHTINLLSACRSRNITYLLLPSVLGIIEGDERIESIEGQPVTAVRPREGAMKWFFS